MSVTRSDGAGKPQPLTQSKNIQVPWSFTPDGKRLAFHTEQGTGTFRDLWTVPLESDGAGLRAGKPEVFLQTPADERYPSFSPDGRWLAYASNESGTFQVYVRAFPDKGGKWQISNSGGTYPMWSRNGHELFFETLDNHIMVAAYAVKGDSFVADKPRTVVREAARGLGQLLERRSRAGRQAHRRVNASRDSGRTEGAEPRDLPKELLRRSSAAHGNAG